MNIHEGQLYWPLTYERKPHTNPEIKPMYDCIVVGGGMSGILAAQQLQKEGLSVAILEMDKAVNGSTSANTGLLQWSNDIMLHELIEQIGEKDAVRFYKLCVDALTEIEHLSNSMQDQADFIRRPSLCFASSKKDAKKLAYEFEALQQHGFKAEFWNDTLVQQVMGFEAPAALKTYHDAEINPLKFAAQLLEQLIKKGVHLFEHTYVNVIEEQNEHIILRSLDKVFLTKKIIFTTGYHPVPFKKVAGANINRTYAIVTNQIDNLEPWHESALLWETARPYYYVRQTKDNRIIIGGLDERKPNAPKDAKIENYAQELINLLNKYFPQYDITPVAMYGASFGESKDNLPFIGEHPAHPNFYYLLGYGGNGTVCSMLGAKILADLVVGRPNTGADIVTLNRKQGVK